MDSDDVLLEDEPVPQAPSQRRRIPAWCIPLIVIGALVGMGISVLALRSALPTSPRQVFVTQCQDLTRRLLKAPRTAQFIPWRDADIVGTPEHGMVYTGQVDAQNALGVPLRTSFSCTLNPETRRVEVEIDR